MHSTSGYLSSDGSPARVRLQNLVSRLTGLGAKLEIEKQSTLDAFENRLRIYEDDFLQHQRYMEQQLVALTTQIGEVYQELEAQRRLREDITDRRMMELQQASGRLRLNMKSEKQEFIKACEGIRRLVEDRIHAFRREMESEHAALEEKEEECKLILFSDLPKISERIQFIRAERERAEDDILERLSAEVRALQRDCEVERQAQKEMEENITKVIEDYIVRLQALLEEERTQRQGDEEILFKLVEDTLNKIAEVQSL